METICIIPARGGSKGVPRKNLRTVGGVTLLERAVRTAQQAGHVDVVAVSTENPEIARVAADAEATVIVRPLELATDEAGTAEVLRHGVLWLGERGIGADAVACVQCTCPFTTAADIDAGIVLLAAVPALASTLTATPAHLFLWERNGRGLKAINHDARQRTRRQEIRHQFVETGAVYVTRAEGLKRTGQIHHGLVGLVIQPPERVLDIDTELDLQRAKAWLQFTQTSGQ